MKLMKDKNLYSGDIDNCFTYVLDYFSKPDKVFYKNYINDSDYTIDKYVFSNLKYIFNIYRSDILKKDSEDSDKLSLSDTETQTEYILKDKNIVEYQPNINEFDYSKVLELSELIKIYLTKKNYNIEGFKDISSFILKLFIIPKYVDLDDNIESISIDLGISKELILNFLGDLKKDFLLREQISIDIYNKISEIISMKDT